MEPLPWTSVIVARDHLAETDLVAVAVPRLSVVVFVVAFALVQGGLFFFRRRPSRHRRRYAAVFLVRSFGWGRVRAARGAHALLVLLVCVLLVLELELEVVLVLVLLLLVLVLELLLLGVGECSHRCGGLGGSSFGRWMGRCWDGGVARFDRLGGFAFVFALGAYWHGILRVLRGLFLAVCVRLQRGCDLCLGRLFWRLGFGFVCWTF